MNTYRMTLIDTSCKRIKGILVSENQDVYYAIIGSGFQLLLLLSWFSLYFKYGYFINIMTK